MSGRTQITLFAGSDTTTTTITTTSGSNIDSAAAATSSVSPAYSIVDLTAAYGPQNASRVERGFAFTAAYEHLFIVDEFEFSVGSPVHNVTWSMHTMASIKLVGADAVDGSGHGSAVLSLGGATLYATLIEPKGAVFASQEVDLQPPYEPSTGVSKLLVLLPTGPAGASTLSPSETGAAPVTRIVVGLSLSATPVTESPNPLAQWKTRGPFAGGL